MILAIKVHQAVCTDNGQVARMTRTIRVNIIVHRALHEYATTFDKRLFCIVSQLVPGNDLMPDGYIPVSAIRLFSFNMRGHAKSCPPAAVTALLADKVIADITDELYLISVHVALIL